MNINRFFSFVCTILALTLFLTGFPAHALHSENVKGITEKITRYVEPDPALVDTCVKSRNNIISVDFLVLFPAISYSRIIPFLKKTGLSIYGSITPYFGFLIDLGGAITVGKNHHYFEPGGGYLLFVDNVYLKTGYRYQSKKGFVFRIAPGYNITENVPWFTTGFGFAF